ncbi:hypothetical protein PBCVKS1B_302L [Paramecium bursaria Chlorella virus KS1B]|nr:hypothetical protein PBCVKS1B_302L [Paramecium bursaria Chlorella virus KS1B]
MYYATLSEAFGVDTLEHEKTETPKTKATTRKTFTFSDKVFGEDVDVSDSVDTEPPPVFIPEDRKLSNSEVKKYIANLYKKEGINAVWNLLDKRVQIKLMGMCKDTIQGAKTFFDDLLSSPEKIMIILAVLFVIIILLDSGKGKEQYAQPQVSQGYYYPQTQQFYTPVIPQNPIQLQ